MAKLCRFPGCDHNTKSKGLCQAHYTQQWRGEELRPLRIRGPQKETPTGKSWCSRCKGFKDIAEFPWDKTRQRPYRLCRWHTAEVQREYTHRIKRAEDSGDQRTARMLRRVRNYDQLWDDQDGKCAICEVDLNTVGHHVDHSHKTGQVRAILCASCNMGLGYFKEDTKRMKKAIEYLTAHDIGVS